MKLELLSPMCVEFQIADNSAYVVYVTEELFFYNAGNTATLIDFMCTIFRCLEL